MSFVLSASTPRARRGHPCSQCPRPIAPGERYFREVLVEDRQARSFATCIECHQMQLDLWDVGVHDYSDQDTEIVAWLPDLNWDSPQIPDTLRERRATHVGAAPHLVGAA